MIRHMNKKEESRAGDASTETKERSAWDTRGIAQSLGAEGRKTRDIAFGEGLCFELGGTRHLELYPDGGFARVATEDARLELFRLEPPTIRGEAVVFERVGEGQSLRVSVSAAGEVNLNIARSVSEQLGAEGLVVDGGAKEQQERITLSGRLGAAPSLRTTPKGTLVARFPVAVQREDKTVWHTVLAFGERAERAGSDLRKGQAVEVVGYVHERETRTRKGDIRIVQEIYAVRINPRQAPGR